MLHRVVTPKGPLLLALVAGAAVLGWQEAQVRWWYSGNRSGLFQTAASTVLPAELAGTTLRSAKPYDGQWYRLVAHDPWALHGWQHFVDDPALRYRRILVPALVWALSASDLMFQIVLAGFTALGVSASSVWLQSRGHNPFWSLSFLLLPGVVVGMRWMTLDVASYGLAAAALAAWERRLWRWCWAAVAAACLARDLGFLVCAAVVCAAAVARQWQRAWWFAAAALPAVAWYAVVEWRLPPITPAGQVVPRWTFHWPVLGAVDAVLNRQLLGPHPDFPLLSLPERMTVAAYLAALAAAFLWVRRQWTDPAVWMVFSFVLVFFAASSRGYWNDALSHPRAFTPWLALLAVLGIEAGQRAAVLPLAVAAAASLRYFGAP